MYTTFYLLNNADTITELCIKTKEEFRLWMELKRFAKEEVKSTLNKETGNIEAFDINGLNVIVTDTAIKSIKDKKIIEVSKDEFKRSTMKSLRKLLLNL